MLQPNYPRRWFYIFSKPIKNNHNVLLFSSFLRSRPFLSSFLPFLPFFLLPSYYYYYYLACSRVVSKRRGKGEVPFQRYNVEMYVHPLSRFPRIPYECFVENFHLSQRIQLREAFSFLLFPFFFFTKEIDNDDSSTQFIDRPNHFPHKRQIFVRNNRSKRREVGACYRLGRYRGETADILSNSVSNRQFR